MNNFALTKKFNITKLDCNSKEDHGNLSWHRLNRTSSKAKCQSKIYLLFWRQTWQLLFFFVFFFGITFDFDLNLTNRFWSYVSLWFTKNTWFTWDSYFQLLTLWNGGGNSWSSFELAVMDCFKSCAWQFDRRIVACPKFYDHLVVHKPSFLFLEWWDAFGFSSFLSMLLKKKIFSGRTDSSSFDRELLFVSSFLSRQFNCDLFYFASILSFSMYLDICILYPSFILTFVSCF